ncbi:heterokaryon incompatibility protein-domain-containing protein, partial [Phaeosphaeria sp. MPI-PUGE-AT-0046c]
MSPYQYIPLSDAHSNIRLLRLLPAVHDEADICIELLEYSLQKPRHSYEALSYVWGPMKPARSVSIGDEHLSITPNLSAALLQLRDHTFPRIVWVDAICINQTDRSEKEVQIQSMARIYACAKRVVVYLGEAADNSNEALEAIRAAGMRPSSENSENNARSVDLLLQREWFQRIWVLQEVAAARHIVVICGNTEIDGHALCLGLENLKSADSHLTLYSQVRSVLSLIRGAIFRPMFVLDSSGNTFQNMCSIGELVIMYSTHKASLRHDKIFALLGMALHNEPGDFEEHGLLPNYKVPWEELLRRLVRFILGDGVYVKTWPNTERAEISGKGYILGSVATIVSDPSTSITPQLEKTDADYRRDAWDNSSSWTLRASTTNVRRGDIVVLMEGADRPLIVRQTNLWFYIIMIEVSVVTNSMNHRLPRDIVLVWDWVQNRNFSRGSREAVNNWATVLILQDAQLFQRSDQFITRLFENPSMCNCSSWPITEDDLVDLVRVRDEQTGRHLLSWMTETGMCISEAVSVEIVQNFPKSLVAEVLDQERSQIQITEKVLILLVSHHTEDMIMKLLEKNRETIRVTESLILMTARRPQSSLSWNILKMYRGTIRLTERIILAIAPHPGLLGSVFQMYRGPAFIDAVPLDTTDEEESTVNRTSKEHASRTSSGMNIEITDAVLIAAIRARCSLDTIREIVRSGNFTDAPLLAAFEN